MTITADLESAYVALQDNEVAKAMQILADVMPKVEKLEKRLSVLDGEPERHAKFLLEKSRK